MGAGNSKKSALRATHDDHENAINCMVLSEDSSLLVTGSDDKTARMWCTQTEDMQCLGVFKGHKGYVSCVAINDTFVLTGSEDCTVRKWDMTTCDCVFVYEGHEKKISRIICTGEFVFSSSLDKTVKAWFFDLPDLMTGTDACIKTFTGHTKGVTPIIFIPGTDFSESKIHPDDVLLTGSHDRTARSWSFDTGDCLKIFKGHTDAITCMVTDVSGNFLYTGSNDGTIRSWDTRTGKVIKVLEGHTNGVMCMAVVNRLLYSGSRDGTARCWVREMGDSTRTYKSKFKESIVCLKFFGGYLFTGSSDTTAAVYDSKSGARLKVYEGHTGTISCLTVIDTRLITGSSDNTLRVWDVDEFFNKTEGDEDADEGEEEDEEEDKRERNLEELDKRLDSYIDDDPDMASSPAEIRRKDVDLDSIEDQLG
ncbi:uncharacterized protein LOC143024802 [Oratosquilla oratoria]|uniref:uncharacterized protein LOC143024802 n=1 Tax=Oratosquilla oratoria TaxID=337810 RepID=UPI003F7671CD